MRPAIRYPTLAVILAVVLQVQSYGVATALTLAFWVILGGHRTLYLIYHTLDRDLRYGMYLCLVQLIFKKPCRLPLTDVHGV